MNSALTTIQQTSFSVQAVPVLMNMKSGESVLLNKTETTVGSAARSDIAITNDSQVAPRHAVITTSVNGTYIQIIAKDKGTWRNAWPIGHSVKLKAGDVLRIGSTTLKVVM